jgi:hypothetical protein
LFFHIQDKKMTSPLATVLYEESERLIPEVFWKTYDKDNGLTISQRKKHANDEFLTLVEKCMEFLYEEALVYTEERDATMTPLMELVQQKVLKMIPCAKPTSSFSARTHLQGDSDIDFTILCKTKEEIDGIIPMLTTFGFEFKETKSAGFPDEYHVYGRIIDGIEIEMKVREEEPAHRIMAVHHFMDNQCPSYVKPYITYLKKLLKGTTAYPQLKYLIGEYALYQSDPTGNELFGRLLERGQTYTV